MSAPNPILTDVLSQVTQWAAGEMSRYLKIFDFLSLLKQSSSGDLSNSNTRNLAKKVKDSISAKYGVTTNIKEIEKVIEYILRASFNTTITDMSPIELALQNVLRIIGTYFTLNKDAVCYISAIAARRLAVFCMFEIALLTGMKKNIVVMREYLTSLEGILLENRGTEPVSRFFMNSNAISDFYAKRMYEAKIQIDKIAEAAIEGKFNPSSTESLKQIVDSTINSDDFIFILSNGNDQSFEDPSNLLRTTLTRFAYIEQLHNNIYSGILQWNNILPEYEALHLPTLFSKGILDTIKKRLEENEQYFNLVKDQNVFDNVKKTLIDLVAVEQTVSNVVSNYESIGTIILSGQTEWVGTPGSDTSNVITNPNLAEYTIKVGDKIAFDSPTLDASTLKTVAYHTVQSVTDEYINVTPAVQQPANSTQTSTGGELNFVVFTGGSEYYGKMIAVSSYLTEAAEDIQSSVLPTVLSYPDSKVALKEALGTSLKSFVGTVNNSLLDPEHTMKVADFESLSGRVSAIIADLQLKLSYIMYTLVGIDLPKNTEVERIDDILNEHGLDILREYFITGQVNKFFNMNVRNSSSDISLISKINSLSRII